MRASNKRAFTLLELVVLMVVISILFGVYYSWLQVDAKRESRKMRCKSNLRHLGTAMIQYVDQYGKGRYYSWPGPQKASFSGAQWIASMYWVGLMDWCQLTCPGSTDDNQSGGTVGRRFTALGPGDVSYAGRNGMMGAIPDKMPANTIMMSDDSEGPAPHSGEGLNLLYFDAHVEWNEKLYPRDVGKTVPLDMLRN